MGKFKDELVVLDLTLSSRVWGRPRAVGWVERWGLQKGARAAGGCRGASKGVWAGQTHSHWREVASLGICDRILEKPRWSSWWFHSLIDIYWYLVKHLKIYAWCASWWVSSLRTSLFSHGEALPQPRERMMEQPLSLGHQTHQLIWWSHQPFRIFRTEMTISVSQTGKLGFEEISCWPERVSISINGSDSLSLAFLFSSRKSITET